ncbi:MAG: copper amine oxidase N-terminal domain-containing protein [Oscillospiraceae bacterium]|nr:copper amine oxidase N-terminal domain-containing protein [Oscillospiraceae bacterium]
MKKIISGIFVVVLLFAMAPMALANISVRLDGNPIAFDVPPQMVDGRTMVPLRAIFDALGAETDWDDSTQTITATRAGVEVSMQVGNPIIIAAGTSVTLDVPPLIIDGRTLVPTRAVAESFGVYVQWDGDMQVVRLATQPGLLGPFPLENHPVVGNWLMPGGTPWNFRANGHGAWAAFPAETSPATQVWHEFTWVSVSPGTIRIISPAGSSIGGLYEYSVSGNNMTLVGLENQLVRRHQLHRQGGQHPVNLNNALVGRWTTFHTEGADGTGYVFNADGTGYAFGPGFRINFNWSTPRDNFVILNELTATGVSAGTRALYFNIEANMLYLRFPGGTLYIDLIRR